MSMVSAITARHEERHALVAGMRRMLDRAETERRDLNSEECRWYDESERRVHAIDREIAEMERSVQRPNPALRALLTTEQRRAEGGDFPAGDREWSAGFIGQRSRRRSTRTPDVAASPASTPPPRR